jgi:hypothetical protein
MDIINKLKDFVVFAFDQDMQENGKDIQIMRTYKTSLECIGSWEDIKERSWILSKNEFKSLKAKNADMIQNQVCFLHINKDKKPYLEYSDGKKEIIGRKFRTVKASKAIKNIGWTYIKQSKNYYIVE